MHLVVECELAVQLGSDLPKQAKPYTRDDVRRAVSAVMPAFELIEDRNADYKTTKAMSLIADNAWNGGIVLGKPLKPPASLDLDKLKGTLSINGKASHNGLTDDPMGALAWVANLATFTPNFFNRKGVTFSSTSIMPLRICSVFNCCC